MRLSPRTEMIRHGVGHLFLIFGLIVFFMSHCPPKVSAASLDGITIIKYKNNPASRQAIAEGSHLVLFISARGSYAAITSNRPAHYSGCTSLAIPGSYTGTSIAFGMNAAASVRKQRLETYCPPFMVKLEDEDNVRVEAGNRVNNRMEIVAHIPLSALDFNAAHFVTHDIKGVKLGPINNLADLFPLGAGGQGPRYKNFQHTVEQPGGQRNTVRGRAAAAEITGWPVDVQFQEQFSGQSTMEAFVNAVVEKYGEPSTRYKDTGYLLWLYDMSGKKVDMSTPMSNSCRSTLEFIAKYDQLGRVQGLDWRLGKNYGQDAWGCSLIMEINGNISSGGVTGYSVRALNGYVRAINYFNYLIEKTEELKKKIDAFPTGKPTF